MVYEAADMLTRTLKGLRALYVAVKTYKDSESQINDFLMEINEVELQLQGLRAHRIALRRHGMNMNAVLNVMKLERQAWDSLVEIDNDILRSLPKGAAPEKVPRKLKMEWAKSAKGKSERYRDQLRIVKGILISNELQLDFLEEARKFRGQSKAKIDTPDNLIEAMDEALTRAAPEQ